VSIGGAAVTMLIILSGAALHFTYRNRNMSYKDFILKRLKRIYPVYWLSIFFTLILLGFALAQKPIINFLLDVSGFLAFTGATWDKYILPMGWFIGLIVSLYFFYPLLRKLFIKYRPVLVLAVLFIVEIVARIVTGKYIPRYRPLDWMPFCRLFEFGFGIYLVENAKILAVIRKATISKISGSVA
jgi:peptidoglycan/LPS O-acetylase OafA/YrhL